MSWRQFGGKPVDLPLTNIVRDPVLQVRAGGTNKEHSSDLAQDLRQKAKLPRVWVMDVEGHGLLLVGGWHTYDAYEINGKQKIPCLLRLGTYAEAMIAAAGSNNSPAHKAKKMTNADKQRAVRIALEARSMFAEKDRPSLRRVAEIVGVSHTFVGDIATVLEQRQRIRGEAQTGDLPEPKAKPKRVPKIDSDDWQDFPVGEYLKLPDFVEAALSRDKVETLGELSEELEKGVTFGLKAGAIAELKEQVEHFSKPAKAEAAKPVAEPFDWKAVESKLGVAVRAVEDAGKHYRDRESAEYQSIDKHFNGIFAALAKWRNRHAK